MTDDCSAPSWGYPQHEPQGWECGWSQAPDVNQESGRPSRVVGEGSIGEQQLWLASILSTQDWSEGIPRDRAGRNAGSR